MISDSNSTKRQKGIHRKHLEGLGIVLPNWVYEGMFERDLKAMCAQMYYAILRYRVDPAEVEGITVTVSIPVTPYEGTPVQSGDISPKEVADYLYARYDNLTRETGERAIQQYCKDRYAKEHPANDPPWVHNDGVDDPSVR